MFDATASNSALAQLMVGSRSSGSFAGSARVRPASGSMQRPRIRNIPGCAWPEGARSAGRAQFPPARGL